MTPQQWADVKKQWFFRYEFRFRVDGYELKLEYAVLQGGRIGYSVYVDGWLKGEWILKDCEERRRFMCKQSKPLHSPKEQRWYQQLAKMQKKKYTPGIFEYYEPWWRSFTAFKRHITANNNSIELMEDHSNDKTADEEMAQAA